MKVIASLAAVAALAAAGSATAQDMRIAWGDLDLGSAAGVAVFDQRVQTSAERFCRQAQRPDSRIIRRQECHEQVRRAVVAELPQGVQADYAQARGLLSI